MAAMGAIAEREARERVEAALRAAQHLPPLPPDSTVRKQTPIYSGVMAYFPLAIAALARVSFKGNEKHNPGEPLHWSREKSSDHTDSIARHLMDGDGVDEDGELHAVHLAWRALANAELALEKLAAKRDAKPAV